MGEDEVGEGGEVEVRGVDVKELLQEGLDAVEVILRLRVEPFEFDVEDVEVLRS